MGYSEGQRGRGGGRRPWATWGGGGGGGGAEVVWGGKGGSGVGVWAAGAVGYIQVAGWKAAWLAQARLALGAVLGRRWGRGRWLGWLSWEHCMWWLLYPGRELPLL